MDWFLRGLFPTYTISVYFNLCISIVLLAPYGLNAHLTSNSLADTDARSIKILEEWKKFFPVVKSNEVSSFGKEDKCPGVIEVLLGDVKMLYPSCLVMVPISNIKGMFQGTN